jgi:hypothetical protein
MLNAIESFILKLNLLELSGNISKKEALRIRGIYLAYAMVVDKCRDTQDGSSLVNQEIAQGLPDTGPDYEFQERVDFA